MIAWIFSLLVLLSDFLYNFCITADSKKDCSAQSSFVPLIWEAKIRL